MHLAVKFWIEFILLINSLSTESPKKINNMSRDTNWNIF